MSERGSVEASAPSLGPLMPILAPALPAGVYHLARRTARPAGARALSALQAVTEHWETAGHGEVRQLAFLSRSQYVAQFSRRCDEQATIRFGSGGIAPLTDGVSLACASRLAREPRIRAANLFLCVIQARAVRSCSRPRCNLGVRHALAAPRAIVPRPRPRL